MTYRQVFIEDCALVEPETDDLIMRRLERSVQQSCKHVRKECISTSSSGHDTAWVRYVCLDCARGWTDELTPAEYLHLIADDYPEPLP